MNVLGIIPARYASQRLEGKPLAMIGDKPMIQWVYEQAKKSLQHVYVATDDQRIFDAVQNFGGDVVMTSTDHNTGTNRCLEAYQIISNNTNTEFNAVLNIQGDEPMLDPEQLKLLSDCFADSSTQMATLVFPVTNGKELEPESDVFVVMDKNNNALYFSREVIPHVRGIARENWTDHHNYYKHIGMYGFTPTALKNFAELEQTNLEKAESLEQLRWLENGNRIKVAITDHRSISVDTPDDLERVRTIILGE